jgi:gliding motility-associated-like protein
MKKISALFFMLLSFIIAHRAFATHLRAGEITAVRISNTSLTYRVVLTTYTDEINGRSANEAQEDVDFFPGFINNGVVSYKVARKEKVLISPSTVRNTYETEVTFPGPGLYRVSCGIPNRNEATINLPQPSDAITFFVQTTLVINPDFGLNSTPVLLNIPVDSAATGVRYIHNPGAFDIDGDSLSYRLSIPMEDRMEANGIGAPIDGYRDPSTVGDSPIRNEAGTGSATFRIDPRTGDLIWDAPQREGQYNVAFVVEEWRKAPDGNFLRIGEIVRDMQIIVVDTENKRPELEVPGDLCIEAGEPFEFEVTATDDDVDQILTLSSSGGVYNVDPAGNFQQFVPDEAATFSPQIPRFSPIKGTFSWLTNCDHVREQAYDVLFKVEDAPGRFITQLVDIQTVKINVNPPRPKGLQGEETEEGVQLSWLPYANCVRGGKIYIYRKDGCSGLNPGDCQKGIPKDWRYELIGEVGLSDTTFLDIDAEKGQIYSYRLVSDIEVSNFNTMLSAPSPEFCIGSELPERVPVITKVSVMETDLSKGQIKVEWSSPIGLDTSLFAGPYQYVLSRTTGLGGDNFEEIHRINTNFDGSADTLFTDTNLNTSENVYKYKLAFYYEGDQKMGEAPAASSVRTTGTPDDQEIHLFWEANTPWSNENQTHLVYREDKDNPGEFNIIAEVVVTGPNTFDFIDDGTDQYLADGNHSITLENNVQYCYKVETVGLYSNEASQYGLLNNFSQQFCLAPADRTPPCALVMNLDNIGCETLSQEDFCGTNAFTNTLTWANPTATCRTDIIRYNIYFSRYEDGNFEQIGFVDGDQTSYRHTKNATEGFAGCYYVTAVSILEVESEPSNVICADNCDKISFPNVFSPNNDGVNDTFQPMNCPAFIRNIDYEIYNRQGIRIAQGGGQSLSWDGVADNGNAASPGTYYYNINVEFSRLKETGEVKSYKGYFELIR